jgi:hypothetical protein
MTNIIDYILEVDNGEEYDHIVDRILDTLISLIDKAIPAEIIESMLMSEAIEELKLAEYPTQLAHHVINHAKEKLADL